MLVVGRVAFVSCVAPRGVGGNLNGSDAAAWWFVCRYLRRAKRHGSILSGPMIVLSTPRRRRGPTRGGSIGNPNNELANRTFETTRGRAQSACRASAHRCNVELAHGADMSPTDTRSKLLANQNTTTTTILLGPAPSQLPIPTENTTLISHRKSAPSFVARTSAGSPPRRLYCLHGTRRR